MYLEVLSHHNCPQHWPGVVVTPKSPNKKLSTHTITFAIFPIIKTSGSLHVKVLDLCWSYKG